MTKFEDLSNELLIDLFEYFDAYRLFLSFANLNNRLTCLLKTARLHFDFDHVSLDEYNSFALSLNPNNIVSFSSRILEKSRIWLFDNNEVLQQFHKICSLTLFNVTEGILNRLHERLPSLKHTLVYINIGDITRNDQNGLDDEYISFKHWCATHEFCSSKYSSLKYFITDTEYNHEAFGCLTPTVSTITFLKLSYVFSITWLMHLFRYSPHLRVLNLKGVLGNIDNDIHKTRYHSKYPVIFPCACNLQRFSFSIYNCEIESIEYIFRACPNLTKFNMFCAFGSEKRGLALKEQLSHRLFWESIVKQYGKYLQYLNISIEGESATQNIRLINNSWKS